MVSCKLCGKKFETLRGVATHLRFCKKNLNEMKIVDYYNQFIKQGIEGKCVLCGKYTRFNGLDIGFSTYCGSRCAALGVNKGLKANPRINEPKKKSVICKMCNKKLNNINSLGNHLKYCKSNIDRLNSNQYYNKYIKKDDEELCKTCGNVTKFKGLEKGYDAYCSKICSNRDRPISEKLNNTIMYTDRLQKIGLEPIYEGEYFTGRQEIEFKCSKCSRIFKNYTFNILKIRNKCPFCTDKSRSISERLIYSYLKHKFHKYNVYNNYKKLLYPFEIDIIMPSLNISLEYNGLYYHSSQNSQNRDLWKSHGCIKNNFKHVVIWEDEFNIHNKDYKFIDTIIKNAMECDVKKYMKNTKYFTTFPISIADIDNFDKTKRFKLLQLSECNKNFKRPPRSLFVP